METIINFLKDFLLVFWKGFSGIFISIYEMLNVFEYYKVFEGHSGEFIWWQWVVGVLLLLCVIAVIGAILWLILYFLRRYIRIRRSKVSSEDLIDEITSLKREVMRVNQEKDRILALKVSQIGGPAFAADGTGAEGEMGDDRKVDTSKSRFYKLTEIDQKYENYVAPEYDNTIRLDDLCERFRNYACSRLKLFYDIKTIRLFISAFSSARLVILQGISGTGKTSLPYAFGKFLQNPVTLASVQPSWRDRTELFGYFNEFTKRFNETEVLKALYEATYTNEVCVIILDEMNIARVEYYFAEMLSILEMPIRDLWIVDLVASGWPDDPKHIVKGRFKLPQNMYYVGTVNMDDSTFAISDKVYDRGMPININQKGKYFPAPDTEPIKIGFDYLESLYKEAKETHQVSQEVLDKLELLDDYVIKHFRLAFGNRILKQLTEFIPTYVATGGTELDGLDYVLANKILRKFESLNLSYIRDEIDGLISYMDKLFGSQNMEECKDYLRRLKKLF